MKRQHSPSFQATSGDIPNVLLRDARKQRHWTQRDVAEQIGVTALTISRWERGETVPDGYASRKLCSLFGKGAEELGLFNGKREVVVFVDERADTLRDLSGSDDIAPHQRLRWERYKRGWSQNDLATMLGCDTKTVARWELGRAIPGFFLCQRLSEVYHVSLEELGLLKVIPSEKIGTRTINVPVCGGDCDQPEITGVLSDLSINPSQRQMTFYFRWINGTGENLGLSMESVSLTNRKGDFLLGRSVGSFHLGAWDSIPFSIIFDWMPKQEDVYLLNIVLLRPNKWRNTYKPLVLTF